MLRFCSHTLAIVLVLTFLTGNLPAQDARVVRTFEQLESFWKDLVEPGQEAASSIYPTVFGAMSSSGSTNAGSASSRLEGIWEGEATPKIVQFALQPIPSRYDAIMARREMTLAMYLSREEDYQPPTAATTVESMRLRPRLVLEQKALTTRRAIAHAELFHIKLLRYQAGHSFETKCTAITEADRSYKILNALTSAGPNPLLSTLLGSARSLGQRFAQDLEKKFACAARPKATRASIQQEIEMQVNTLVLADLTRVSDVTIQAIQGRLALYDAALTEIRKVDPRTEELLAAERDLKAASSNIKLIADDLFGMRSLMPQLDAIDFSHITNVGVPNFEPDPITVVKDARVQLVSSAKAILARLNTVPAVIKADQRPNFQACLGLDKEFEAALPKPGIPSTAMGAFQQKYESCLNKLSAYLSELQQKDSEQAMVDQFARYLQSLSTEIVAN